MARTITIPSTLYQPQVIERGLDSFPADVRQLRVSFTRENWPGAPEDDVITVTVAWDDGAGGRWTLPGGTVLGRDGQPLAASVVTVDVPEVNDGTGKPRRKNVVGGVVTVEFHQALRTAITAEAL